MPDQTRNDLDVLLAVLPPRVREALLSREDRDDLLEIVLDLGRAPEGRFVGQEVQLSDQPISADDLAYVVERIGDFGDDNRAGIGRTLHRISAIRNRRGEVVGLTCRVGRAIRGTVALLRDVVEEGRSILILGRPGVGKTTLLREAARAEADELGKRVVVVDTSNEIAGDGDVPHPGIGRARRMQVARPAEQHRVMIEAVENHMPEVIVIDEIGTELEAQAARTIAERGVQLIGTAHGRTLENLLLNPTLSDLVGGIQAVTLGDEEARRRGTQKTVLERKAPPTFDVLVEQLSWREVIVHRDIAGAVDALLRGQAPLAELRERDEHDRVHARTITVEIAEPGQWGRNSDTPFESDLRAFAEGRRNGMNGGHGGPHGASAWKQRGLHDPRRMPDDEPRWEDQIDEALSVEAAEPTGTTGVSLGSSALRSSSSTVKAPKRPPVRIYPFGVSRERLEQSAKLLRVPVEISADQSEADAVITLKTYYKRQGERLRSVEAARKPVYVVRTNTVAQMQQCLARIFDVRTSLDESAGKPQHPTTEAIQEAEDAIHRMLNHGVGHAELAPQSAPVRRIQHRVAERYNLESRSFGREPYRRVRIYAR
jgi:stage III sporulation protein SpoIIIAA